MSDPNPLVDLQHQYEVLCQRFDVEPHVKVFNKTRQDDGSPHIELHGKSFDYVITERGAELIRERGLSMDDVLFLLLKGVTGQVARKYEMSTRVGGMDGRSVWFPLQERLMAELRLEWGVRLKEEHRRILLRYPFEEVHHPQLRST